MFIFKRCTICKFITDETIHHGYKIRFAFLMTSCKGTNAIYWIHCKKCSKIVYVGETSTTIYQRFQNQVSSVNPGIDHPVSKKIIFQTI